MNDLISQERFYKMYLSDIVENVIVSHIHIYHIMIYSWFYLQQSKVLKLVSLQSLPEAYISKVICYRMLYEFVLNFSVEF